MKNLRLINYVIILFVIGLIIAFTSCTKKKTKYTIAGIVFQNDLFMRTVQLGMSSKGKELGVEVLLGNSDNKIDKEAQLIDTYIAAGVNAIAITPLSAEGSVAALKRAEDAGIKIVYFNTEANVPAVSSIGTSNSNLGKYTGIAARDFIEEKFAGKTVEVAMLNARSQLPEAAEQRSGGFFDEIKEIPGVKLVADQDAWLAEMAVRVAGDILTANPNVTIIHAINEGGTVGAVQAIRNAGKQGEVFVFGIDASDQIAQMLLADDNVLQAATAQKPFAIGSKAIETAVKSLKGESVEEKIDVAPRPLLRSNPDDVKKFQKELESYK